MKKLLTLVASLLATTSSITIPVSAKTKIGNDITEKNINQIQRNDTQAIDIQNYDDMSNGIKL